MSILGTLRKSAVFLIALWAALASCQPRPAIPETEPWHTFDWPEADRLFQEDVMWRGGDGAYSIDLGGGRVLWLFGDSWIDPTGSRSRRSATMVSNSLGIQRGYDPSRSSASFYWRTGDDGRPRAFFGGSDDERYWPGHGAVVQGRLVLFLMSVRDVDDGLGFEVKGWRAVLIANPDEDPPDWEIDWLDTPTNELGIVVGSGGVLLRGDYVYAFGAREPDHDVYLARWLASDLLDDRMNRMEWWSGSAEGWSSPQDASVHPRAVFEGGQTEFTVHYSNGRFFEYQTEGFGATEIVRRSAPELTGPWSPPARVFTPPQGSFPGILIYQGKAHPHLRGAPLVLTYSTNSLDLSDHFAEPWLYFPRFVRLGPP